VRHWREDIAGSTVGFVGAGQLGGPMVERLLAADRVVALYARRAETVDRLTRLGAEACPGISDVGARADIAVVCAYSDAQLLDIATGPDGLLSTMRPGSVLVSHVTGGPSTIERLAGHAATRGVGVVDAPVSGTAEDIRAGRLTVLVGGSTDLAARVAPALAAYADPVIHTGPRGSALRIKLINNAVFTANVQVALDAIAAAADADIPFEALVHTLQSCSARSGAFDGLAAAQTAEEFAATVTPFLRKDLVALDDLAETLGPAGERLRKAAATGPLDVGLSHDS
jgi:3-hydroxyisobutyrate dehydrogenase-like beta-hydroxyacid dehydrogenase